MITSHLKLYLSLKALYILMTGIISPCARTGWMRKLTVFPLRWLSAGDVVIALMQPESDIVPAVEESIT